jgi:choline dehydrogenase-like flavoprotein
MLLPPRINVAAPANVPESRDLVVLRLVCDTFFPRLRGEADPGAHGGAGACQLPHSASDIGVPEAFAGAMETLDTRSRAEIRLLLRVLDTPLLPALLLRRVVPFGRLDESERERLLLLMGASALPPLRSAYQALKRLTAFLYLSLPTESGENPAWEVIGYRPPPAAPARPPALRVRTPLREETLEADAVVVGSGAGGGVAAAVLARRGMRVVVLEAGGGMQAPDFSPRELEGMRDLFLDSGTTATVDLSVAILAGGTLGGGTTVNWQSSFRTPDEVRAEWSDLTGRDFAGEAFGRALDAACSRLHVSTGAPVNAVNAVIREGCRALGQSWSEIPRNERGCAHVRCAACTFGCPLGAKQSSAVTWLADAQRDGDAEILVRTRVERVRIESGRAVGVEAVARAEEGREHAVRVHAPLVVMAAGALRTPVLLTRSGVRLSALGRNLWLHPVASVAARFADPVRSWEGAPQTVVGDAFAGLDGGYGFRMEAAPAHPGLLGLAASWTGGRAARERVSLMGHLAPLIALVRDRTGGRVAELRGGGVRIDYHPGRAEQRMLRRALVEMCRIQLAAGAEEVYTLHTPERSLRADATERARRAFLEEIERAPVARNRSLLFSAHQMGTARMGREPRDAVCDATGRVFGVGGLYVADASAFPSSSGVNPMISVMALAGMVAEEAAR